MLEGFLEYSLFQSFVASYAGSDCRKTKVSLLWAFSISYKMQSCSNITMWGGGLGDWRKRSGWLSEEHEIGSREAKVELYSSAELPKD